ncbi:hypothetical protein [Botrimarina sp.]|uniref:hypothetical protein n=1 Tax=Botrimarina sp. TaxID=2795802 RepID=UPI0032EE45B2
MLATVGSAAAQLTLDGFVYHEATRNGYGVGTQDSGGALFAFVRNNTGTTQTFTNANITLNGQPDSSYANHDWSRVWPLSIEPGEVATVTLKGNGGVFAPGGTVQLGLASDGNATLVQSNLSLTTPKLRVGNVVPSQDLKKAFVYLRNDDSSPYTIDSLHLNDDVTSQSRIVGGSTTISPNSIKIVEVDFGVAQDLLTPYAVRVEATRTQNGQAVTTGAPVRLTEPIAPVGSWQASLSTDGAAMRDARRQFGHSIHGATSRFPDTIGSRYEDFSIRGLHIDVLDFQGSQPQSPEPLNIDRVEYIDFSTGNPVAHSAPLFELPDLVAEQADNPAIYGWYVRDEPDLQQNSSTRDPQAMWRLNDTYWRNSEKPTFLNMVKDGQIQRYGLIADHPAIDRYMQRAPLSDSVGNRNIDQTLQYADSLKNNVEPLRMWWVSQGLASVWSDQPTDWGIDVQFWSSVMGGAKGNIGFMFENNESAYPAQHARIEEVLHEFQTVRNLVLYGEPLDNTSMTIGGAPIDQSASDITAAARSIISEHAVVLPVANLTGRQSFFSSPAFDVLNDVVVEVEAPDWIQIASVKRVTKDGYVTLDDGFSFTQDGQRVTIRIDSLIDTDVFLISEADTEAPATIDSLRVVGGSVFSWDEPHDNFGVHGYQLLENGIVVDTVPTPYYQLNNFDPRNTYRVRAFDASNNFGPLSNEITAATARWDGNDPSAGVAGDGLSWSSPNNWSINGAPDVGLAGPLTVTLFPASPPTVVNLQGERSVISISVEGDYIFSGNSLTLGSGEFAVSHGARATVASNLLTTAPAIVKSGDGQLVTVASVGGDLLVEEGLYGGTATHAGDVDVVAGATLRPGNPAGAMRVRGQLTLREGSTFAINVSGNGLTGSLLAEDVVGIEAGATLALVPNGFVYQVGYARQVVTALAGGEVVGAFTEFDLPDLVGGRVWTVTQDPSRVLLRVISTADYNADGVVDAADYTLWRDTLGQTGATLAADGNGNGAVDAGDYDFWLAHYGEVVTRLGQPATQAPEPASAVAAAVAIVSVSGGPSRRTRRDRQNARTR